MCHRDELSGNTVLLKNKTLTGKLSLAFEAPAAPVKSGYKPYSVKKSKWILMGKERTFLHLNDVSMLNYRLVLGIFFAFSSIDFKLTLKHFVGGLKGWIVCQLQMDIVDGKISLNGVSEPQE